MLKLKRCFSGFHGRIGGLQGFRSFTLLYSTSAASKGEITNPLMVQFLVRSVGFSEDEAVAVVTKCKLSHRFRSTKKSELVVDFFKHSGFDESHIRKVVICHPMVLNCKVEKTLKPKIRAFQELGFSGSGLGLLISQQPHFLLRSLNGYIVPALELLKSCIGCKEQLVSFLLKRTSLMLLNGNDLKNLPANLELLQSYGLTRDQIKRFILQRFNYLLHSTQAVEEKVKEVEEKLGIPRTSGMFMYGIYALCYKNGDPHESWLEIFHRYGWSKVEIFNLVRKWPVTLTMSEKQLKKKLKYFIEDIGYGSDNLAVHPALLSYSMEKRIIPRTAVIQALKEKKLLNRGVSLYYFLCISEPKFRKKFLLPFKDDLPEIYLYYTKTARGCVSLKRSLQ